MGNKIEIGDRIGCLTVLEFGKEKNKTVVKCVCECGREHVKLKVKLHERPGRRNWVFCCRQCPLRSDVIHQPYKYKVNIGDKIGCLTVLEVDLYVEDHCQKNHAVKLKCECGKEHIKINSRLGKKWTYCCKQCPFRIKELVLIVPPDKYLLHIGETYEYLTVIENPIYRIRQLRKRDRPNSRVREQIVKCHCNKCGKERMYSCKNILNGDAISCGCIGNDVRRKGTLAEDGVKKCCRCLNERTIENFKHKSSSPDKLYSTCNFCNKDIYLRKNYGITLEQYNDMLVKQNNCCACCKQPTEASGRNGLHVDHSHTTKEVRGLLCSQCNTGIGKFREDVNTLQNAINYLNQWSNYGS
jgi:hypothetical protein